MGSVPFVSMDIHKKFSRAAIMNGEAEGEAIIMTSGQKDILGAIERHREEIRRLGVRGLALFGSSARGEEKARSDLDFVVEFETKSFDAYMDLKEYLEELLGRRVDLVLADAIKPRLRSAILEEAVHAPGL